MKRAGRGENVHLSLQDDKMVVLCLSAVPFHPPSLHAPTPTSICYHYVLLPPIAEPWLWRPRGHFFWGGEGWWRQAGGSSLLKRLEQSMASHQQHRAPGGPHSNDIRGDVFLNGEEGRGACWELMRRVGGGGGP